MYEYQNARYVWSLFFSPPCPLDYSHCCVCVHWVLLPPLLEDLKHRAPINAE